METSSKKEDKVKTILIHRYIYVPQHAEYTFFSKTQGIFLFYKDHVCELKANINIYQITGMMQNVSQCKYAQKELKKNQKHLHMFKN